MKCGSWAQARHFAYCAAVAVGAWAVGAWAVGAWAVGVWGVGPWELGPWAVGEVVRLRREGNLPAAVVVALLSTVCYATSAVLQELEASRQETATRLIRRLLRRPRWWLAVVASATAAALHIVALALGPLSVVQPLGVLTLVLALPLGARWGGRAVTGRQWCAAVAVAAGLAAVLGVAPHRARHAASGLLSVPAATGVIAAVVVVLVVVSGRLPMPAAPVARASAAGICFGFASGMTRVAAVGAAPFVAAATLAVLGAASGFGLAQLAYRNGGLGAPLATLILIDPLVAVVIGVTVLGEPVPVSPLRIALGIAGLIATTGGIWVLAQAAADREAGPVAG